jgi:hypothetical protein
MGEAGKEEAVVPAAELSQNGELEEQGMVAEVLDAISSLVVVPAQVAAHRDRLNRPPP